MKFLSRTHKSRRAGFTAIELMTVLTVVAIGVSLATPAMRDYVDSMRTRRALDQVVADLAYARLMAIEDGRKSAVRFQSDGTYTLEAQVGGGGWTVLQTKRLRDDYEGVSVSGSAMTLEFSSRGLVTNLTGDAYLKVTAHAARDSVFVSPVGRLYRAF